MFVPSCSLSFAGIISLFFVSIECSYVPINMADPSLSLHFVALSPTFYLIIYHCRLNSKSFTEKNSVFFRIFYSFFPLSAKIYSKVLQDSQINYKFPCFSAKRVFGAFPADRFPQLSFSIIPHHCRAFFCPLKEPSQTKTDSIPRRMIFSAEAVADNQSTQGGGCWRPADERSTQTI